MNELLTDAQAYDAGYEHGRTGRAADPTLIARAGAAAYLDGYEDGAIDRAEGEEV